MAYIWKEIELTWEGKTYTIKPTIELINRIEQGKGCSLTSLLTRTADYDLPSSLAAKIISVALDYAGVKATQEEVYMATGGTGEDLMRMAAEIIIACIPPSKDESGGAAKKQTASQQQISIGQKSMDQQSAV